MKTRQRLSRAVQGMMHTFAAGDRPRASPRLSFARWRARLRRLSADWLLTRERDFLAPALRHPWLRPAGFAVVLARASKTAGRYRPRRI